MRKKTIICITLALLFSSLTLFGQEKPKNGAGDPEPLYVVAAEATASSFMVESDARYFRYHPWRAFDDDPLTAWNEGEKGPGAGESIVLDLARPVLVDAVEVLPGYFDPRWHGANNRIKTCDLFFFNPSREKRTLTCADEMKPAVIAFETPVRFQQLVLQIRAVYPGVKYDDTCVSEIRLFFREKMIRLESGTALAKMKSMEGRPLVSDPSGLYCYYDSMYERTKYYFFKDGAFVLTSEDLDDGCLLIQNGKWRKAPGAAEITALVDLAITVKGSGAVQTLPAGIVVFENYGVFKKKTKEQLKLAWAEWVSLNRQPLGSAEYEIRVISAYHDETVMGRYDAIASAYKKEMESGYAEIKKHRDAGEPNWPY